MKSPATAGENSPYRWFVLFVSLFAFVAYAFSLQTASPLLEAFVNEFGISNAEAGLVISIVLLPGIFLGLPAGLVVGKYGVKRVGLISLTTVSLGSLVSALANSFPMLLIGRLILGIGGTFIITTTPTIVAQWFARKELGKAMGIFAINMPLATVIALPTAAALENAYNWHFPFYVSFAIGAAAIAAYTLIIKDGPFAGYEKKTGIRKAATNFEVWKVGLVWLFFNASALSFIIWGTTLFTRFKGVPNVQASIMASLLMWTAIFFVPVFGYLSDKTDKRKRFAILGAVIMAVALLTTAFTSDAALVVSILALGIAAAAIPPVASALPVEILGPALASVGFGITGICLNIGAAAAQPLLGYVLDTTQAYAPPLIAMAVLSALGAMIAYTLKTK